MRARNRNATLFTSCPVVELIGNFWILWVIYHGSYFSRTILFTPKKYKKKRRTPFLLKIVTWNFKQFGSPWNFNEFSITKFHKVSIFLNIFLNLLKFLKFHEILYLIPYWNFTSVKSAMKFHWTLKFWLNFTKVSLEISLKLSIEFFEHYTWGPGPILEPKGPELLLWPRHL